MGNQSIVNGYILVPEFSYIDSNMKAISSHNFDDQYPFTNIFWRGPRDQYFMPVIAIAGSYREIENDWNEWLWKFSQLLSSLEAIRAKIYLDCILGDWKWVLKPESLIRKKGSRGESFIGQTWGISSGPEDDFSLRNPWIGKWPKTVRRWSQESP